MIRLLLLLPLMQYRGILCAAEFLEPDVQLVLLPLRRSGEMQAVDPESCEKKKTRETIHVTHFSL